MIGDEIARAFGIAQRQGGNASEIIIASKSHLHFISGIVRNELTNLSAARAVLILPK